MAAQPSIDEMTLRRLSQQLGNGWESLATFLNISAERVSLIKLDHRVDGTEEQVFQMLLMWNNGFDQEGSRMDVLMRALGQHGRSDLANKLNQGTLGSREEPPARRENVDCLRDEVLRKLCEGLGRGWEQLATHLGVSSTQVNNLKRDHYGAGEQIFQMLINWRNNNNSERPVDVLNRGLRQIGRNDLAVKLSGMIEGPQ